MDALPVAWRQSLKTCECTGTVPFNLHDQTQLFLNCKKVLLSKAESKIICKELRNRVTIQPSVQRKYIAQFENDNLNWKKIYSLPFLVTMDIKSREFQYKLLNRCIVTKSMPFYVKSVVYHHQHAFFCGETDNSLENLFVSCHYTRKFWAEVIKWLNDFNRDL